MDFFDELYDFSDLCLHDLLEWVLDAVRSVRNFSAQNRIMLPRTSQFRNEREHAKVASRRLFRKLIVSKTVLVVTPFHETGMSMLEQHPDIELCFSEDISESAICAAVGNAHAIIVRNGLITRKIIDSAPALEVVSRTGVGVDNVDIPALTERNIPLTITPNANATSVAEHAMYMILTLAKKGHMHHRAVTERNFAVRFEMHATDIESKRLLIIGFGRIGTRLAPRAAAFGMQVDVYDPYVEDAEIEASGCSVAMDLDAALSEADYVSLHCPLTDETRHIISSAELSRMKTTAVIINTARGGVVDEDALVEALNSGSIAGAGADVFVDEPPPGGHPLLSAPNMLLSPHHAGVSLQAAERAGVSVANNTISALFGTLDRAVVVNLEVL